MYTIMFVAAISTLGITYHPVTQESVSTLTLVDMAFVAACAYYTLVNITGYNCGTLESVSSVHCSCLPPI